MNVEIRILNLNDAHILNNVNHYVFDEKVDSAFCQNFLSDSRHHFVVAMNDNIVIGMATGLHHIHPDCDNEFWVMEIG